MDPAPSVCPNADAALVGHSSGNNMVVCTIVACKYLSKLEKSWEAKTFRARNFSGRSAYLRMSVRI